MLASFQSARHRNLHVPDLVVPSLNHAVSFIQYKEAKSPQVAEVRVARAHQLPQAAGRGHNDCRPLSQQPLLLGRCQPPHHWNHPEAGRLA